MFGKEQVVEGLHFDNSEFAGWEPKDKEYRESEAAEILSYRLYEVVVYSTADLDTGDYQVNHFEYDGVKYVPEMTQERWNKLSKGEQSDFMDEIGEYLS